MNTHSIIGSWNKNRASWQAVYVHHNGCPSGVGATLFQCTQFQWSASLTALSKRILSVKQGFQMFRRTGHTNILEDSYPLTENQSRYLDTDKAYWDVGYAYLIDPWNNCLTVLYRHVPDNLWEDSTNSTWLKIGDYSFDAIGPDWEQLDQWRPPQPEP